MVKIITENLPAKLNQEDVKAFYQSIGLKAEYQEPINWTMPDGTIKRGHTLPGGEIEESDSHRIVIFNADENDQVLIPEASAKTQEEKRQENQAAVEKEFEDRVIAVLTKHGLINK